MARFQRGAGFPHDKQGGTDGELPFFKVGDFNLPGNERYLRGCSHRVSRETAGELRAVPVPPGTLLLPKIGAALLGNARRIAVDECVFDNNVLGIVPGNIEPRYLAYWMGTIDLGEFANPGPIPSLNDSATMDLPLAVIDITVQRAIADFLDTETPRIDALIAKKRRMIELLSEHWWSGLQEVVDAPRLGEQPEWIPIRRFVTSAVDGPFGSALTSSHYAETGARVVRLGNIGRGEWRDQDQAYIDCDYWNRLVGHHVAGGDLLIAALGDRNNPVGRACAVPEGIGPGLVKADCFRFRLGRGLQARYAALALSSPRGVAAANLLADGATRSRLTLDKALALPVPAASSAYQEAVVDHAARVKAKIAELTAGLTRQAVLLAEYRQALVTAAVTGQRDIPATA